MGLALFRRQPIFEVFRYPESRGSAQNCEPVKREYWSWLLAFWHKRVRVFRLFVVTRFIWGSLVFTMHFAT